jgi:hypothetical protein
MHRVATMMLSHRPTPSKHMIKWNSRESLWQKLANPVIPEVDGPSAPPLERRDVGARHALLCRIHSEFEEMRGLSLTRRQAAKLFGLAPDVASRILDRLTDARVLCEKTAGQFALRAEET